MTTDTLSKSDLDELLRLNADYIHSVQHSDVRRFAQLAAAAPWLSVELDHAAVLLQAARVGLVDEEMRVVLDRHGTETY